MFHQVSSIIPLPGLSCPCELWNLTCLTSRFYRFTIRSGGDDGPTNSIGSRGELCKIGAGAEIAIWRWSSLKLRKKKVAWENGRKEAPPAMQECSHGHKSITHTTLKHHQTKQCDLWYLWCCFLCLNLPILNWHRRWCLGFSNGNLGPGDQGSASKHCMSPCRALPWWLQSPRIAYMHWP